MACYLLLTTPCSLLSTYYLFTLHGKARGLLSIFESSQKGMSSQKKDKATYDMETKKYKKETAQTPILTRGEGGVGGRGGGGGTKTDKT